MPHFSLSLNLQCALWTILHTLKAKYTFRAVLSFTGIIRSINIHWTHFFCICRKIHICFYHIESGAVKNNSQASKIL